MAATSAPRAGWIGARPLVRIGDSGPRMADAIGMRAAVVILMPRRTGFFTWRRKYRAAGECTGRHDAKE
jgi:hypothetical protein